MTPSPMRQCSGSLHSLAPGAAVACPAHDAVPHRSHRMHQSAILLGVLLLSCSEGDTSPQVAAPTGAGSTGSRVGTLGGATLGGGTSTSATSGETATEGGVAMGSSTGGAST